MNAVADLREQVYDHFHGNVGVQQYFYDAAHDDEYVGYYNSMTYEQWQRGVGRSHPRVALGSLLDEWVQVRHGMLQDRHSGIVSLLSGEPSL